MKIELDDIVHISETSLTIRGPRRRTTVPKEIAEFMQLKDGDRIQWVAMKDGVVFIKKTEVPGRK